jgi:hypothetical protein
MNLQIYLLCIYLHAVGATFGGWGLDTLPGPEQS